MNAQILLSHPLLALVESNQDQILAARLVTEAVDLIMRPSSTANRWTLTSFSNIQSLDKPG